MYEYRYLSTKKHYGEGLYDNTHITFHDCTEAILPMFAPIQNSLRK